MLRGLCCFVFSIYSRAFESHAKRLTWLGRATNDVYFYLILLPDNLPSKLPHPLWISCEFDLSSYRRDKGTNSQRGEDFACLWPVMLVGTGMAVLLCSGVGCFDVWCWQEWDRRIISVCVCLLKTSVPWEDTLRREQWWDWEVGTRQEIEVWLTGWWTFVSPLDVLIHVICFSYESNIKKNKSPRNSYTRSTQDNHKAYVCQYDYSFCHVGKYLNSIYNLGHTREFSGCIYIT